ncbi:MAG: helix-turn-helix domain-containing protein [Bacteroidota bacterium]
MTKQEKPENNLSTEEKFKDAARVVFTKKGYAATKTRDIAEEAGLNLALLNYYFRSKENLFEIVMQEKILLLFSLISPIVNDGSTSLEQKIDGISVRYIDMLLQNPDLPLFVLSEIKNNPERFGKNFQVDNIIMRSHFVKQLAERNKTINPVQLILSFIGMLVFPFIAKPVLQGSGVVTEEIFSKLMDERKQLTARWMKMMLD